MHFLQKNGEKKHFFIAKNSRNIFYCSGSGKKNIRSRMEKGKNRYLRTAVAAQEINKH